MNETITIFGMYNFDPTIFDEMEVPNAISKEDVVNNIIFQCAEMELAYVSNKYMKHMIGIWSRSNKYTWDKIADTLSLEYNPIENYDRKEHYTLTTNETNNTENNTTGTIKENNTLDVQENGKTTVEDSGNTTNNRETDSKTNGTTENNESRSESISAFDSTNMVPRSSITSNADGTTTSTTTGSESNTTTEDYNGTSTDNNTRNETGVRSSNNTENFKGNSDKNVTTRYETQAHGNIGVTTSQQMIEAERNVAKFNLIDFITTSFKKNFCLLVY